MPYTHWNQFRDDDDYGKFEVGERKNLWYVTPEGVAFDMSYDHVLKFLAWLKDLYEGTVCEGKGE